MVTNDSLLSRLLPGLLVAAAIFAAWWLFIRAGDHPSVPNQAPGLLDAPSSVGPMLLQASQLGPTYDQSAQDTRATTSVEIRKGQSPVATRVIAHTWKAGARAGWSQVHGSITVLSRAELFTGSDLGAVSAGFERQMVHTYHGKPATAPGPLPGQHGWLLQGTTVSQIYSTLYPPRRQVAVYGWQHGDVLAILVVTGLPRDGVLQAATTLANAQDQNIGFVTRG
jgi:hypothetical protein